MEEKKEKFAKVAFRRIIILKDFLSSGIKILVSRPYWKKGDVAIPLIAGVLINVSIWAYLFANEELASKNYPIILHYNPFFGVDYLGSYSLIYMIPFVGIVIIIINTILGYWLYSKEKLASYFLSFNILIAQIFLFIAGYLIIKANS